MPPEPTSPALPCPQPITDRVLIIEQFGELGQSSGSQLSIILVVDKMHNGRLKQLGWLGQSLQVGSLSFHLGGQ
jgi:hypothetical protein